MINIVKILLHYWKFFSVVSIFLLILSAVYRTGFAVSESRWAEKWQKRDIEDAQNRSKDEIAKREEEHDRQILIDQVNHHAQKQLETAHAEATAAHSSADKLQRTIEKLRQQTLTDSGRKDADTSGTRAAETRSTILLTKLLAESVERNRQLAGYADQARVNGTTCEKAWDEVMGN
ncbi:DUF2514 domain-containing protein [Erwinia oleae]|uniref:DUF2514 domain-containing protein n=1 Tax=Erwinia oleae TaxID=796334 RepID=UPI000691704C|nr:DUF2514 domain-containing protein [Erwinia oleae]